MKSPVKVSRRKKLEALALCAEGRKQEDVAYEVGISISTIKRSKKKQRLHGDIEGGRKKQGRKPTLTADIINVSSFLRL
jgi:transposase